MGGPGAGLRFIDGNRHCVVELRMYDRGCVVDDVVAARHAGVIVGLAVEAWRRNGGRGFRGLRRVFHEVFDGYSLGRSAGARMKDDGLPTPYDAAVVK